MAGITQVVLYAVLPALGVLLGAMLAACVPASRNIVGAALHAAGGIAIALVCFELAPRALDVLPMWAFMAAFLIGGGGSLLTARWVAKLQDRIGASREFGGAMLVSVVVVADLVSDGLMVGAGAAAASGLGLLLAASQSVANMPGGFAAAANLRERGVSWATTLGFAAALLAPALVSAAVGYWVLSAFDVMVRLAALAAVSGLLLLATIEDMIPEGDEHEPPRWLSTTYFALGFAGMGLISAYAG